MVCVCVCVAYLICALQLFSPIVRIVFLLFIFIMYNLFLSLQAFWCLFYFQVMVIKKHRLCTTGSLPRCPQWPHLSFSQISQVAGRGQSTWAILC